MAHKQKKDPFSPIAFLIAIAILGATVFVLVSNLLSTIERNSVKGAEDNSRQAAVADESLKPVGSVITTADAPKGADVAAAPASGGSADGAAIYKATCFACHTTGVAGSPILGNKEQWEPRVATGLDALMTTAMNGKGAMPAKGGNTALSEAEVKAAVLYMTKEAGFDLGGDAAPKKAEPAAPATAKEAPAKEEAVATEAKPEPVAPEQDAPAKEETAATEAKSEPVAPTKPEPVAEPKKPETPAIPAVPSAPAAPTPKEAPAAVVAPAEKPAEATTSASTADGKAVYNATCFACHKTGVAGAPLFGDKALWAPRIATGMDALISSVINGKGAMPPKGGNTSLSDDDVKAAVAYMVEQAK